VAFNVFDEALDALDEQQAPAPPNPFLETLDDLDNARTRAMRRAQIEAATTTPDRAADVRKLSMATGLAPEVVERNFDDLSKRVKVDTTPYAAMQKETPALAEWTADPHNAALAKDDMEQLGLLEWIVTAPQRAFAQSVHQMRAAGLRTQSLYRDLTQAERDQLNAEKFHAEYGGRLGAADSWFRSSVTGGAQLLANVLFGFKSAAAPAAIGAATGAVIGGVGGGLATAGAGALPGAGAGAKFGAGVGAAIGGAKFGFELEAGLAYDEYLDFKDELGKPLDPTVAKAAAFAAGAINAGLEVVGLGILARSIPGLDKLKGVAARGAIREALRNPTVRAALASAMKEYAGVLTAETAVEVAQRAVTIMSGELGKVASGQDIKLRTPSDVLDDLVQEGIAAAQGFVFVAAPGPTLSAAANARRAQRAQQAEAFFVALGEGVSQSQTIQRMPAAAQQFLEQATKDGPVATVYAPVETFAQYWQDKGLDPRDVASELTGDPDAYETAIRTGEDLQIPTARYAVKLAGTEHHAFFAQELRLGPDEMNAREGKAFQEQLTAAMTEAAAPGVSRSAEVRDQVLAQLEGAGVPRETAETYAALFESSIGSLAARAGLDPAALYAEYGLTVERPSLAEGPPPAGAVREPALTAAGAIPAPAAVQPGLEDLAQIPGFADLAASAGTATLEAVEPGAIEIGGSLESAASLEAQRRQQGMQARGEQFVVFDRTGRRRILVGPEAVDYQPRQGETYGVQGPTGFRILEDRGGKVQEAGPAVAPGGELRRDVAEPLAPVGVGAVAPAGAIARPRGGERQLVPAETREYFDQLLDDARRNGFTGDDDVLAARFLERLAHAQEIAGDLESFANDQSWRELLVAVSKAGGIGLDAETKGMGGYSGEVAWLLESLQAGQGVITRGRRAGKFMPRLRAGIKGAPGVILGKGQGGRSLDSIRESLEADPSGRWTKYTDLNLLLADLEDAVIKGHYENQGLAVPGPASPAAMDVLNAFLNVRPGELWWTEPAAEAPAVEPTEGEIEEFGQSLFDDLLELPEPTPAADVLETGEVQARLPGEVGAVREAEVPTPEFEAPFALTPEAAKVKGKQTTLFQPAFHGSPHRFDRFTLNAIGSGEGAQAYGWGLYFASQRSVADWYRSKLAGPQHPKRLTYDGVYLFERDIGLYFVATDAQGLPTTTPQDRDLQRGLLEVDARTHWVKPGKEGLARIREDLTKSIANLEQTHAKGETFSGDLARDQYDMDTWRAALRALDLFGDKLEVIPAERPGRTYTVEIPGNEDFLDWDKPLSEQPEKVKRALTTLGIQITDLQYPTLEEALELFNEPHVLEAAQEDIGTRETFREGYLLAKNGDDQGFRTWWARWGGSITGWADLETTPHRTGETVYRDLQQLALERHRTEFGGGVVYYPPSWGKAQEMASKLLLEQGVAGLRYLDAFSRGGAAEGSYNFVVFDDSLVEIVQYDQPGAPRLSAIHQLSADNLKFAARMGGIAVPSIAVLPEGTPALKGYGDVTLIGTSALGDPARQPVFDADIYSATFPKPEYGKAKTKDAQALVNRFRRLAQKFDEAGLVDQLWDRAINRPDPAESIRLLRRSPAAMALFLEEQGITLEPILRDANMEVPFVAQPAFQAFLEATGGIEHLARHDHADTAYRTKLADAIRAAIAEHAASVEETDADLADHIRRRGVENWIEDDGLPPFGWTLRLERSIQAIGRKDVSFTETREALEEALRGKEAAFQAWIDDQVLRIHPPPQLTVNRRKVPYTLANIVEHMTGGRRVKAVEKTLTFGEGAARAYAATRFTDIEWMRNAAYQIRPEQEIDEAREHAKKLLEAWRDAVLEYSTLTDWRGQLDTWHALDASMRALAKWAGKGQTAKNLRAALVREGFVNVPSAVVQQGVEAGKAFLEAPVPYFESKPQRAVGIDEFAGAVIPTTADEETRAILAQAGVRVAEYDPAVPESRDATLNALRTALAAEGRDVLFQGDKRGSIRWGPNRQMTINLLERADLSTFLHEGAHFFLEVFGDLADKLIALPPEQVTAPQKALLADYNALLKWMGVASRDDVTLEQHEQFARGFEAYLMEGKAPSLELREAFARFRAWLLGIYRTLRGLNVQLTDEVRKVFDRMLASDQAILEAEAAGRVEAMFTTAESAGMSAAEFDLYRAKIAEASRSAREQVDRRILAEVQREQTAQWKESRAAIETEVTQEIQQQPVYRALAAMQRGTQPDGSPLVEGILEAEPMKLSRRMLVERYGEGRLKRLPKPYIYRRNDGLDPDTVAAAFGFSSGDELLAAIEQAPAMKAAIQAETERRMLAEHGSLLLDGTLQEKAQTALSNEDRELVIRAELRALGRLWRQVRPFVRAAREEGRAAVEAARAETAAAEAETRALERKGRGGPAVIRAGIPPAAVLREAARARVARTKVRDLRPQVFWSASRRAAQQAIEAAARQDFDRAIVKKQEELLNLALYREAARTVDDVDQRVRRAKDLGKPPARARLGLAGEAYLDQVDGILDRYEFAPVSQKVLDRRASLRKFVAALEGEGLPVDLPEELLEETRRTNYAELTVEELIGVTDGLAQIVHLARLKSRLLRRAEQRELDQVAGGIADSIREHARRAPRAAARDRRPSDERRRAVSDFFAGHRKLASMLRELDGFVDGGPAWEAIMRPLNEAGAREAELNADATRRFAQLVERAFPGKQKQALYTRIAIPAVGRSLSRMERLMVALNWGNDGNRDRVRRAEGWSDQQVQAILDTLTAADLDFVQGVFDFLDSYWPDIKAKQERVYGVAPEKVEATPIAASAGTIKGGYFPLKYDDRLSARAIAALDLEAANLARQAAYTQATTRRGHTKERIARVKLPVRLDFGVMFEHVAQVIHDLTHHETLIDVGRVLAHSDVQQAILETQGDLVYKQIRGSIRDVAFGDVPAVNGFERAINHVRMGATIAGLGWNLAVAFLQPIGLSNSMVRIGPTWVAKGLARWLRNPFTMVETVHWITEKSAFMRARGRTQQREINEIRNQVGVETGRFTGWVEQALRKTTFDTVTKQGITDSYFWMIQQMQRIADVPTWLGAYEKAMAGGELEDRAVALADQAVLDSQGGGQIKDLAQVQRGGPMMRLWTNFYSYFNVVYNQAVESRRRTRIKNPAEVGRLASDYLMLFIVPATLGLLLRESLRPRRKDDEDEFAKRLILEQLSYIAGTMLGLREVSGALQGYYGYEGPAGARAFAALSRLGQQIQQGELDEAFWRALNSVAGVIFHYPATQVERTTTGVAAIAEGRTSRPTAVVAGPPRER
jgi:hypothetical protein